jgi:hypothetical protein
MATQSCLLGRTEINPALYDEKFVDENDEPTCSLKIIPPKCTPLCLAMYIFTDK